MVVNGSSLLLVLYFNVPLLLHLIGSPLFWHALASFIDMWTCMAITSNVLQAVIAASCWRIYRELRVNRLYPVNSDVQVTHDQIHELEILCEPDDINKCHTACGPLLYCAGREVQNTGKNDFDNTQKLYFE